MENQKEFKVVTEKNNVIMFQAFVNVDTKEYKVKKDFTGNFEKKFNKIMDGTYSHKFVNNSTEEIGVYTIDGNNHIENLAKYAADAELFSHTRVSLC